MPSSPGPLIALTDISKEMLMEIQCEQSSGTVLESLQTIS
jgi:hypothetical protein